MTLKGIPVSALGLTAAGALPFVAGAVIAFGAFGAAMGQPPETGYPLITATDGILMLTRYGVIILCFMSGVLWGFATRAEGTLAAVCYVLSVLPALWAFLVPGSNADEALFNLIIGFVSVLLLDFAFHRWGLTPHWWMRLRVPVTAVVVGCLALGIWA